MRIGILGAAQIARHAVVAPAARLPEVQAFAVAARDPDCARAYAEANGIPHVEPTYDALLARADLDLIYVALHNAAHAAWSIRALEADHGVLCEKPFAMNAAEGERMVEAAQRAGRPLLEGFAYRHHALIEDLMGLVRSGAIGPVRRAHGLFVANHPPDDGVRWSPALGASALLNLGCYPVHALRTVLGEEPEVTGARGGYREGVNAWLEGELTFPSGVRGRITCSHVAEARDASLRLEGEAGELHVLNFVAPQVPHRLTLSVHGREPEVRTYGGPGTYDGQLLHAAEVLAGRAEPLTGGADALANLNVLDALDARARAQA